MLAFLSIVLLQTKAENFKRPAPTVDAGLFSLQFPIDVDYTAGFCVFLVTKCCVSSPRYIEETTLTMGSKIQ